MKKQTVDVDGLKFEVFGNSEIQVYFHDAPLVIFNKDNQKVLLRFLISILKNDLDMDEFDEGFVHGTAGCLTDLLKEFNDKVHQHIQTCPVTKSTG